MLAVRTKADRSLITDMILGVLGMAYPVTVARSAQRQCSIAGALSAIVVGILCVACRRCASAICVSHITSLVPEIALRVGAVRLV